LRNRREREHDEEKMVVEKIKEITKINYKRWMNKWKKKEKEETQKRDK
jgi:hypothetical protein